MSGFKNCFQQLQQAHSDKEASGTQPTHRVQFRWTEEEDKRLIDIIHNYEPVPGMRKWDRVTQLFGAAGTIVRSCPSLELHFQSMLSRGLVPQNRMPTAKWWGGRDKSEASSKRKGREKEVAGDEGEELEGGDAGENDEAKIGGGGKLKKRQRCEPPYKTRHPARK